MSKPLNQLKKFSFFVLSFRHKQDQFQLLEKNEVLVQAHSPLHGKYAVTLPERQLPFSCKLIICWFYWRQSCLGDSDAHGESGVGGLAEEEHMK